MTQEVDRAERRTDVRDAIQDLITDALTNDADAAGELDDSRLVADYGLTLHFTDGDVVHVLVLSEPDQLGDATARVDEMHAAIPPDLAHELAHGPETYVPDAVLDAFRAMAQRWEAVNRLHERLDAIERNQLYPAGGSHQILTWEARRVLNLQPYRPEEPTP